MRSPRPKRAFMGADVLIGLAIVITLMATLAVAVTRQTRAARQLAESRAAVRLAEATITALQSGQPAPAAPVGAKVTVWRVESVKAPPGTAWATVSVTLDGRTRDLAGLVRADALKGATP